MSDYSQKAVDAALDKLIWNDLRDDDGSWLCDDEFAESVATGIVEAVRPHIEAEERERLLSLIDAEPVDGESAGIHIRRTRTGTWRIELCEMEIASDETEWWPSFEVALDHALQEGRG